MIQKSLTLKKRQTFQSLNTANTKTREPQPKTGSDLKPGPMGRAEPLPSPVVMPGCARAAGLEPWPSTGTLHGLCRAGPLTVPEQLTHRLGCVGPGLPGPIDIPR